MTSKPVLEQLPMVRSLPLSNDRYKLPEIPLSKPVDSQMVTAMKPNLESLKTEPKAEPKSAESKSDAPVARRCYPDITARPEFAHAEDYSWVVGELSYLPHKNQWRVRYTSIDDEDRYGGSVTLDASHMMDGYKTGQLVRVKGEMVDKDSREPAPKYRVNDVEEFVSK